MALPNRRMTLRPEELECLQPNKLLNGSVIEAYLCSLRAYENDKIKVHTLSPFFFMFLDKGETAKAYRELKDINLFNMDLVLVPVHLPNLHHWALIAAFPQKRRIESFDSLGCPHKRHIYQIYYALRWEAKLRGHDFRPEAWHLQDTMRNLPRQQNDIDCGVFILHFSKTLASGGEVAKTKVNVLEFRKEIEESIKDSVVYPSPTSPLGDDEGIIDSNTNSADPPNEIESPSLPVTSDPTEENNETLGFEILTFDDLDSPAHSTLIPVDELISLIDDAAKDFEPKTPTTNLLQGPDTPISSCLSVVASDFDLLESPLPKAETSVTETPTTAQEAPLEDVSDRPVPLRSDRQTSTVGGADGQDQVESFSSSEKLKGVRTPRFNASTQTFKWHLNPRANPTDLLSALWPRASVRGQTRRGRGGHRRIIFPGGVVKRVPSRFLHPWNGF